ncbi:MAG: hypothetical protein KC416_14480, partial [Myxococcales bacterium]|nr:hypothetical protein [Myxococcales bacterium]
EFLRNHPGNPYEAWREAQGTRRFVYQSQEIGDAEHYLWAYQSVSNGTPRGLQDFITRGYGIMKRMGYLMDSETTTPTKEQDEYGFRGAWDAANGTDFPGCRNEPNACY